MDKLRGIRKDIRMQITEEAAEVGTRQPTVSKNTSLGREFYRSATWQDGQTTVRCEVIAFVTGVRALRKDDGSVVLLDQITRFHVLNHGEFVQPVERAVFLWERDVAAEDGTVSTEYDVDYSNEIGLFYSPTVEDAEEQCRRFVDSLDFGEQFDPAAWK
jgi:hypothetical protein